jgi:electron transfer flavoprotein beta subunit
MNIIVPIKQVPDLVEELEIDANGKELNREWLKLKINEFDDHALEEALCLKEEHGGTVTVVALDGDDIDKALFTASAKGADRLVRITGADGSSNHAAAAALAKAISGMSYDLVLTGVQAADDRDGQIGVLLAHYLNIPHICVVTHIDPSGGSVTVQKEYGGGTVAEFSVGLPAVLGVQAARQAPRYVPVARVRQVMRSAEIEDVSASSGGENAGSSISRMFKPESGGGAEMLSGSASDVAGRIIQLIRDKGVKI